MGATSAVVGMSGASGTQVPSDRVVALFDTLSAAANKSVAAYQELALSALIDRAASS
jgi:hypothetical protein